MTNGELLDKLWDLHCTTLMCSRYHHAMCGGGFFSRLCGRVAKHAAIAARWDDLASWTDWLRGTIRNQRLEDHRSASASDVEIFRRLCRWRHEIEATEPPSDVDLLYKCQQYVFEVIRDNPAYRARPESLPAIHPPLQGAIKNNFHLVLDNGERADSTEHVYPGPFDGLTYALEDNWYLVQFFWPFPVDKPEDHVFLYLWVQADPGPPIRITAITMDCPFPDGRDIRVVRYPESSPVEGNRQPGDPSSLRDGTPRGVGPASLIQAASAAIDGP